MQARGFTLIELLVTTSIFIIITVVVLANYPRANGAIALRLLAHDIALSIREAQVYGVSIRGPASGGGTKFPDYGLYFEKPGAPSLDYGYTLFADIAAQGAKRGNGTYDKSTVCDGSSECQQQFSVRGVNKVIRICGLLPTSTVVLSRESCLLNTDNALALEELTVLFQRPNPEALLSGKRSFNGDTVPRLKAAGILIGRSSADEPARLKMVVILNSGQITVQ